MINQLDPSLFSNDEILKKINSDEYFNDNEERFAPTRLRSERIAADYDKLISLIGKIIDITNESRERKITFISYSSYKKAKDIETPIVIYRTRGRQPRQESKPRLREVLNDEENKNRTINVYGQQFNYVLEFIVIDSSDEFAESTMGDLEDLILTYTGFFMSHGVSHIRFLEQLQDESIVADEEEFYTKTLLYSVVLEKITLQSEDKIRTIIQRISVD